MDEDDGRLLCKLNVCRRIIIGGGQQGKATNCCVSAFVFSHRLSLGSGPHLLGLRVGRWVCDQNRSSWIDQHQLFVMSRASRRFWRPLHVSTKLFAPLIQLVPIIRFISNYFIETKSNFINHIKHIRRQVPHLRNQVPHLRNQVPHLGHQVPPSPTFRTPSPTKSHI